MTLIGWYSRAIAYVEKSLQIRTELGNAWGRGQSLHFYGVVLYTASRFAECMDKCREAVTLLEQTGDPWELSIARWQIAGSLYRLGRLDEALEEARRIRRDALQIGDAPGSGMSLDVIARASRGDVSAEAIRTELQRAQNDGQRGAMLWLAEGVRLCGAGRWREAAEAFETGHRVAETAGVRNTYVLPLLPSRRGGPRSHAARPRAHPAPRRKGRVARGVARAPVPQRSASRAPRVRASRGAARASAPRAPPDRREPLGRRCAGRALRARADAPGARRDWTPCGLARCGRRPRGRGIGAARHRQPGIRRARRGPVGRLGVP
jgi:two-component system sensor kinase